MAAAPGFFLVGGPGQNPGDNPAVGSFDITLEHRPPHAEDVADHSSRSALLPRDGLLIG